MKKLLGVLSLIGCMAICGCNKNDGDGGKTTTTPAAQPVNFAADLKGEYESYFTNKKIAFLQFGDSGLSSFETALKALYKNSNINFVGTIDEANSKNESSTDGKIYFAHDVVSTTGITHIDLATIPNDYLLVCCVGFNGKGLSEDATFKANEMTAIKALASKLENTATLKCVYAMPLESQYGDITNPYMKELLPEVDRLITLTSVETSSKNYFSVLPNTYTNMKVSIQSTAANVCKQLGYLLGLEK